MMRHSSHAGGRLKSEEGKWKPDKSGGVSVSILEKLDRIATYPPQIYQPPRTKTEQSTNYRTMKRKQGPR